MSDDERELVGRLFELVDAPFHGALRALLSENAALKASDPLAEMWRELAEYQTQADADGHGESWRIMCSERTTPAAWEAWGDAVRVLARHEARVAARSAGDAASLHSAFDAVTAIRKAKEAKR
jgi:hypothetical protein